MSPLNRGTVATILEPDREKYDWRWLADKEGDWWGASTNVNLIGHNNLRGPRKTVEKLLNHA